MAGKQPSYVTTILEPLASAAVGYGVNQLLASFGGEEKKEGKRPLPNYASPSGPVYYEPGGKPPRRRKRNRRRKGRKRGRGRPRQRRGPRSSYTQTQMPVAMSDSVCNYEPMFYVSPTRNTTHGPSATISFSVNFCLLGTNGVATRNDYVNAIDIASFASANGRVDLPSGFISTDGNYCSAFECYPGEWSARLNREFQNWTEYRPRKIAFRYQNFTNTSVNGALNCCFTRDGADFVEAAGATFATLTHNVQQMGDVIPNCSTNVYRDFTLPLSNFDQNKWYMTQWSRSAPTASGSDPGTVAFIRQASFGRFVCLTNGVTAGAAANYGNLWISGVLDVAGPTSSNWMIPTTQQTTGLQSSTSLGNIIYHEGEFKHVGHVRSMSSSSSSSDDCKLKTSESSLSKVKLPTKVVDVNLPWEDEGTP